MRVALGFEPEDLDTPLVYGPKVEPIKPEQITISMDDYPKYGGYEKRILRWDGMPESQWSQLWLLAGGVNMSGPGYILCKMLNPVTVTEVGIWAVYSCIIVAPSSPSAPGEAYREQVEMEIRKMKFVELAA